LLKRGIETFEVSCEDRIEESTILTGNGAELGIQLWKDI
jgi:hypothetical protein